MSCPCQKCGKAVLDYVPKYCCSGIDCGCRGLPVEPCFCEKCWEEEFDESWRREVVYSSKEDYEDIDEQG